MINIVLVEPRIPQNTGNIGRLALCANARVHLIHPLGFILDSKEIRRTGMDYFNQISLLQWDSLECFLLQNPINDQHFFLTTKSTNPYFKAKFSDECFLYFRREDSGLPSTLLENHSDKTLTIPMFNNARSLNLANSVSIVVYEAIRQNF